VQTLLTSLPSSSPLAKRHCSRGLAYKGCFFGVVKRLAKKTKEGFTLRMSLPDYKDNVAATIGKSPLFP